MNQPILQGNAVSVAGNTVTVTSVTTSVVTIFTTASRVQCLQNCQAGDIAGEFHLFAGGSIMVNDKKMTIAAIDGSTVEIAYESASEQLAKV